MILYTTVLSETYLPQEILYKALSVDLDQLSQDLQFAFLIFNVNAVKQIRR